MTYLVKNSGKRLLSVLLSVCLMLGMCPLVTVQAAEIKGGTFDPHTGNLEIEFGFQATQYVNIKVYARSITDSGQTKTYKGSIAENFLLTGAVDLWSHEPEKEPDTMQEANTPVTVKDAGLISLTDDGVYKTDVDFAGNPIDPTDMMKHTMIWDGSLNGIPILGPNTDEDVFYLSIEIEPVGRPDKNIPCSDEDDGNGGTNHTHGKNFTWTQALDENGESIYGVSTELLVDYRNYVVGEDGTAAFLMLNGSLSDSVRKQLYEQFAGGSLLCEDVTNYPTLDGLVLDSEGLDPVNMITGAYNFTYNDLRLEGKIPLTFMRIYNSRYEDGSLGRGFTHSYDYSLINDRGIIRVTMPGGEEQIFLTLAGGGYDSLENSEFTMEDSGEGYRMIHEDGAVFNFSSDGKLQTILNPDGTRVAQLSYSGDELSSITGVAGKLTFAWNGGNISSVTDSAGRKVIYGYSGDLLTSFTNADGDTLSYTYDSNGYLSTVSDFETDIYVMNTYDSVGRVTEQKFINADISTTSTVSYDDTNRITTCKDANGFVTKYYYDNHRNILKIGKIIDGTEYFSSNTYTDDYRADSLTDEKDGVNGYEYDSAGNVVKITYADGTYDSLTYTSNGEIASVTDALGNTEYYTYSNHSLTGFTDKNDHTTSYTYNELALPATVRDALGNTTTYTYDSASRLTSVVDAEGGATSYEYDDAGRIKTEKKKVNAAETAVTAYEYSNAGKLMKVVDALGNETTYTYNDNGFETSSTDVLGATTTSEYGTNGQIVKSVDEMGNATNYSYSADTGFLESVTGPEGDVTTYSYNERGLLESQTDALGNQTKYEYDALGRVEKTTDALGGTTAYEYDSMGRQTSITDALGNKTFFSFDEVGRKKSETDAEGGQKEYTYDAVGNMITSSDGGGNTTKTEYDAVNRAIKITDAEGNATTYSYDRTGRLTSETDALGNTATYTYDLAGNMTSETDPNGNTTRYSHDLLGHTVEQINADNSKMHAVYDELGRVTESYDELNAKTSYSYDANGNILTVTDPMNNITSQKFDKNNKMTGITYPDGGTETYTYDGMGNELTYTDQLGNVTRWTYDALGRVTTVSDPENHVTQYTYDAVGNIIDVTRNGKNVSKSDYDNAYRLIRSVDGLGNASSYSYDASGNKLAYTDREGNTEKYEYNKNGQLIKTTNALGGVTGISYDALGRIANTTDANGNITSYTYDANGNILTETDSCGGTVTKVYDNRERVATSTGKAGDETIYNYDAAGNLLKETDALGASANYNYDANRNLIKYTNKNNEWIKYDYDKMNRQVKETNQLNHAKETEYDKAGNRISFIDGDKNKTTYTYDKLNRLISETNGEGGISEYTYNYLGDMASFTTYGGNGKKGTTLYSYDASGNLVGETSPLGNKTTYTFDKEGNVLTKTDENGKVTTYTYDKVYNLTGRTDADGTASYAYDATGNMTSASDASGNVIFFYDKLNRMALVENEDGTMTGFAFDAAGNRTSIDYPDGKSVSVSYDIMGNVSSQTDYDNTGITYTRDAEGRPIKEAHSDGSTTEYDYNSAGLLTLQKEVDESNVTRRQIAYTYDDAGNLISENRSGVDIQKKDQLVRYYYDKANRLIKTTIEGETSDYTYDEAGNMLSDGKNSYTYDLQNRLLSKTGTDGTTTYTYDAAGNLIKETSPDGAVTYTYSAQNKLVKGEKSDGQSSTYTYNSLGVRIQNVQVRRNKNAGVQNSDLKDGSHDTDYMDFLKDGRFDWQRAWETEVGTTVQNDYETVTKHYLTDYLSKENRDIMVIEDGSFTQRYLYDENGTRISAEFNYAGGTQRGQGGENLQSDFAANYNKKVWYRTDRLGTTLFATDNDGDVVSHSICDPWGSPLTETYTDTNYAGIDNTNNFTGYTWDETLGLYFAQNRFYSAETHRFTQEDPAVNGANWYSYCNNSPQNYIDMSGLVSLKLTGLGSYDMSTIRGNYLGGKKSDLYAPLSDILGLLNAQIKYKNDASYGPDLPYYTYSASSQKLTHGSASYVFSKNVVVKKNGYYFAKLSCLNAALKALGMGSIGTNTSKGIFNPTSYTGARGKNDAISKVENILNTGSFKKSNGKGGTYTFHYSSDNSMTKTEKNVKEAYENLSDHLSSIFPKIGDAIGTLVDIIAVATDTYGITPGYSSIPLSEGVSNTVNHFYNKDTIVLAKALVKSVAEYHAVRTQYNQFYFFNTTVGDNFHDEVAAIPRNLMWNSLYAAFAPNYLSEYKNTLNAIEKVNTASGRKSFNTLVNVFIAGHDASKMSMTQIEKMVQQFTDIA